MRYLPDGNFTLVLLQDRARSEPDWSEPKISNRYLRRLASPDDAADGHVASWDRIFQEFRHHSVTPSEP